MRREREYEQRFGKTLDEDVKIGVILALAPSQVQNHCHLKFHILKSSAQVRTMLFDFCRAQADTAAGDVVPWDVSVLGKGKGKKGKGKGKKSDSSKDEKDKDEHKKGKGKAMPKRLSTFLDTAFSAKPGDTRRRIAGGKRAPKSGKDTASLETPITPAADATTEPSITGMLMQSDEGEVVPANPAQWPYLVTKREPSREEFLIDSGPAASVCQPSLANQGSVGFPLRLVHLPLLLL